MLVGDHEVHAAQAALLEPDQEVAPRREALPAGQRHSEHLALTVPIYPDGHEHRTAADDARFAHPFVTRVEHDVGELLGQRPRHEPFQLLIELHRDRRHRARAEAVAAQLLGDGAHLARRDALHDISASANSSAFSLRW